MRQIQELKFQEVWHIRNKSSVNFDKILEALMENDADGRNDADAQCSVLTDSESEYFSPLILSLLKSPNSVTEGFIHRLVFAFHETDIVVQMMKTHLQAAETFSDRKAIKSLTEIYEKYYRNKTMIASILCEVMAECENNAFLFVDEVLQKTPSDTIKIVINRVVGNIAFKNMFNPFEENCYSKCVLVMLEHAHKHQVDVSSLKTNFHNGLLERLKSTRKNFSEETLMQTFKLLPLTHKQATDTLAVLLQEQVQKISASPELLTLLTGVLHSLKEGGAGAGALHEGGAGAGLFAKLLCVVEVLLAPGSGESRAMQQLVANLTGYIQAAPTMAELVGSNLVSILLR